MNRTELLKIAKPILFNTEMVEAILEGRKTVTRRVVKPQPNIELVTVSPTYYSPIEILNYVNFSDKNQENCKTYYPTYNKGDILYVRETWTIDEMISHDDYLYRADDEMPGGWYLTSWKPSIHMPKEAARIFLRVTDVRCERLQDITPEQVDKEGCKEYGYNANTGELLPSTSLVFSIRWNSTIKKQDLDKYGWKANPWVWVYGFERVEVNNENNND